MICVTVAPLLLSPRGGIGPLLLGADSSGKAVVVTLSVFSLATLYSAGVGRLLNAVVGMFVLGAGLFMLAGRTETAVEYFHGGSLSMVLLEQGLWIVVCLVATGMVFLMAGWLSDIEPDEDGVRPHPIFSGAAMRSLGAGVIVLPVVWILAQTPMKGQVLGAVVVGSMFVGLVGRLFSPHVQPWLLFVSPILFGGVGQVLGVTIFGGTVDMTMPGSVSMLHPLNMPMPLDYAAGSLMGVALGLGWAKSFLQHEG